jgi:hypothetical protein
VTGDRAVALDTGIACRARAERAGRRGNENMKRKLEAGAPLATKGGDNGASRAFITESIAYTLSELDRLKEKERRTQMMNRSRDLYQQVLQERQRRAAAAVQAALGAQSHAGAGVVGEDEDAAAREAALALSVLARGGIEAMMEEGCAVEGVEDEAQEEEEEEAYFVPLEEMMGGDSEEEESGRERCILPLPGDPFSNSSN